MYIRHLAIFLCLILSACANPEKEWELAERDDSQNAYLEFLAKHPDSKYAEPARQRINELKVNRTWERTTFRDSADAYTSFIKKHPNSKFVPKAEIRLQEIKRDERWEKINNWDDEKAINAFLSDYPDAPQTEEAMQILSEIEANQQAAKQARRPKEREGKFRLQLAAFKTVRAAEKELRRLMTLAPETLIGPVRLVPPEQKNGLFVLKSVPMTWQEANESCASLKRMSQNCLIINR
ncbi:MAG: SPOR domain-containing protein [Gammaproteobacteria bacterium]|nr:SPOR domain-containing protein [Gammaproteobacteria bacterium]